MARLSRLLHLISLVGMVPHELCHYLTARLLGVRVRFDVDHVRLANDPRRGRLVLVLLAPALVGVVAGGLLVPLLLTAPLPVPGSVVAAMGIGLAIAWWGMCADDFFCVAYLAWRGRWPRHMQRPRVYRGGELGEARERLQLWRDSLRDP
jgi:hypothetical protein